MRKGRDERFIRKLGTAHPQQWTEASKQKKGKELCERTLLPPQKNTYFLFLQESTGLYFVLKIKYILSVSFNTYK